MKAFTKRTFAWPWSADQHDSHRNPFRGIFVQPILRFDIPFYNREAEFADRGALVGLIFSLRGTKPFLVGAKSLQCVVGVDDLRLDSSGSGASSTPLSC